MFKRLFILLTLIVVTSAVAQAQAQVRQKILDSLNKLNNNYQKQDTVKVKYLLDLAKYNRDFDNVKSFAQVSQALSLSQKLDNKRLLGQAYLSTGQGHNSFYRYKEAIAYKEKAVAIFKEIKHNTFLATALYNIGLDYYRLNEWYKGLDYFQQALVLSRETKQPFGEVVSLIQIANSYTFLGNHAKALDAGLQALKASEQLKNDQLIATSYNAMASSYMALNQAQKAMDIYEKVIVLKLKVDDKPGIIVTYVNMANTAGELGNNKLAREYYGRALVLSEKMDDKLAIITAEQGEGLLLYKEKEYAAALKNFEKALATSSAINENVFVAAALYNIANVYASTSRYAEAEQYYLKALANYSAVKDIAGQRNVNLALSDLHAQTKNYDKAYEAYKSYISLRDTIYNNEIKIQISRKEMQFDFDKKENSYLLNQQIANQQIAQQQIVAVQQLQLLQLNTQKLQLANKEKSIQRLAYLKKQSELMHVQQLQQADFEKRQAQGNLKAAKRDRQISEQQEQIAFDKKIKNYLGITIFLVILIAALIFYNQLRTARLNRIISIQKKELEQLGNVKDRIFSIVSHDMRTPVNALISFIQLLENGNVTPEKLYRYADTLKAQLTHTSNLMENLLNWASTQMQGFVPMLENVDLNELIKEISDSLYPQIEHKAQELKINAPAKIIVHSDRNMLSLIIRNLISNSIKYTPTQGVISVDAISTAKGATIIVADNGVGISSTQLAQFNDSNYIRSEKSTPGTNKEKGTGLGLMLCKSFTGILKGEIKMENNEGTGVKTILEL